MDVDIVFDDGASRFAVWRNVMVQVRRGRLTLEALDLMAASWRASQMRAPRKIFGVFIVTKDADLPTADVRAKQRQVIDELSESGRLEAALVIEGEGIFAETKRLLARSVARGPVHAYASVEEAARALARFADAPTEKEILEVVRIARG